MSTGYARSRMSPHYRFYKLVPLAVFYSAVIIALLALVRRGDDEQHFLYPPSAGLRRCSTHQLLH